MKRVYLSRHAKSSWKEPGLSDHDRPLNKRGLRDAPIMAAEMLRHLPAVDVIVSSTARRARDTARYYHDTLTIGSMMLDAKLYHADLDEILEVIGDLPSESDTALLFGHNPGFTYLYNHFADELIDNLPTSGLFGLHSTADDWYDLDTTNTRVEFYRYPKMFL